MALPLISQGEVQWITAAVAFNSRNDGRKRDEFRPLKVQLGVLAQATGSARVQLGETDVIIAIKVRKACRNPAFSQTGLLRRRHRQLNSCGHAWLSSAG
jgi:exosome complex RNA-binding protein Rrp42 (RNase PH superfamily)